MVVANVKRKSPYHVWLPHESLQTYSATSERPAKRVRPVSPTICPQLITLDSTDASALVDEDPFWEQSGPTSTELSSHDEFQLAQQAMLVDSASKLLGNDAFNEFIRSPSPCSDYSGETAVSQDDKQDIFAHQTERDESNGNLQNVEIEKIQGAIRI